MKGGGGKGELRESRKTERRNSRRPGKMCIVCTHEGNYPPPPSLFPLPPLVLSLFFPFREEEEKEVEVERERKREKGNKIPNFRGRFAVKGSQSRLLARVFR